MQKDKFQQIEEYMLRCINDGAHDRQHIYRVLYFALDIASEYTVANDVLIAASLLHDIGRDAQYHNPMVDHAIVGADMAYDFLLVNGWPETKASHVKACISTHRYRNQRPPISIEAKILFDADKLDVTGAMGIARTLAYKGIVGEPLYLTDQSGEVLEGKEGEASSFFQEYNWKLKKVYDSFFTSRAREIAKKRRQASIDFYNNIYGEAKSTHHVGLQLLKEALEES